MYSLMWVWQCCNFISFLFFGKFGHIFIASIYCFDIFVVYLDTQFLCTGKYFSLFSIKLDTHWFLIILTFVCLLFRLGFCTALWTHKYVYVAFSFLFNHFSSTTFTFHNFTPKIKSGFFCFRFLEIIFYFIILYRFLFIRVWKIKYFCIFFIYKNAH